MFYEIVFNYENSAKATARSCLSAIIRRNEKSVAVARKVMCVSQISEFAAPPLPPPSEQLLVVVSSRRHCHCQCDRSSSLRRSDADSSLPVVPTLLYVILYTVLYVVLCVSISRRLFTRMFLVLDRCSWNGVGGSGVWVPEPPERIASAECLEECEYLLLTLPNFTILVYIK